MKSEESLPIRQDITADTVTKHSGSVGLGEKTSEGIKKKEGKITANFIKGKKQRGE